MRIIRVDAGMFGPLKGETLELAPGMTVVHGPNEAGKSSWHAALYAGVCGRRRGPGAGTREDRAFAERHRPWDGDRWEIGAVVELADGRRVELHHDLAGGVDCRATDLTLGRDVSDEIMGDGAPDGARWLGLDRRTMPATVFVRQADVLGVLDDPDRLQEALQRAAATGGADATAEHALQRIAGFRKERVGTLRRNSPRPLPRATRAVEEAEAACVAARRAHEEYTSLVADRDDAAREAAELARRAEAARAAQRRRALDELRTRLAQAERLTAAVGEGEPPRPSEDEDALAEEVSRALARFEAAPNPGGPLQGPDAEALAARLAALPEAPAGDLEVADEVAAAHDRWDDARRAFDAHQRTRPDVPARPQTGGLDAATLRSRAEALERPMPEDDPELRAHVEQLRTADAIRRPTWVPAAAFASAGSLLAGGLAVGATGQVVAAAALLLAACAALVAGVALRVRGRRPAVSPAELASAEARLALHESRRDDAAAQHEAARAALASAGLPAEPTAVRALARTLDEADAAEERERRWTQERDRLAHALAEAATALWAALRARGEQVGDGPDVGLAYRAYERNCLRRAEQARTAAARAELEAQLEARRQAEEDAQARLLARERAERELRAVAERADVPADREADTVAARLTEWLRQHADRRREHARRREAWLELGHVLGDGTIEDLRAEVQHLTAELSTAEVEDPPDGADVETLRAAAAEAAQRAAHLAGRVSDRESDLPSVTEAEECLGQAQRQLERLRRLDASLETAARFLEAARERVHRDIAPQLKAAVERHLPTVTHGRYDDVLVDPATLQVKVRSSGQPWRDATLLSHGTSEQVYLLLRLAMAEHLVKPGEVAPLVLDDVTVQSDESRTEALLDLLHRTSRERQVILFSQERAVLSWAERTLRGPGDAIVRLAPAGHAAA